MHTPTEAREFKTFILKVSIGCCVLYFFLIYYYGFGGQFGEAAACWENGGASTMGIVV